jgi:hypothetical protein
MGIAGTEMAVADWKVVGTPRPGRVPRTTAEEESVR